MYKIPSNLFISLSERVNIECMYNFRALYIRVFQYCLYIYINILNRTNKHSRIEFAYYRSGYIIKISLFDEYGKNGHIRFLLIILLC